MTKGESKETSARSSIDLALTALGETVRAMSEEERQAMFEQLGPPPKKELENRLQPFRTPVTERTMRRSVRSS